MKEDQTLTWQIAGPVCLLAACAAAAVLPLSAFPFDLCFSGALGLYLVAKYRAKGCSYALILLALTGTLGHLFLEESHFLRLGLEATFALSFFIASLVFDSQREAFSGMEAVIASREAAIKNLEEEMAKAGAEQVDLQLRFTKKWDELQKNYEDLLVEKSSLEILNDVLRKANAAHAAEKSALEEEALDGKRRLAHAFSEEKAIRAELDRLKQLEHSAENRLLQKELNGARFEKEQTRLINETLVRMHAAESLRAAQAEEKLNGILGEKERTAAEIQALLEKAALLDAALVRKEAERGESEIALRGLEQEVERLGKELAHSDAKRSEAESALETLQASERVEPAAVQELRDERARLQEHLAAVEAKVAELAKTEALYRQLKLQFEEKNRTLHETRAALFKAETELQTASIEREEETWLPDGLKGEFERIETEIEQLEKENRALQDLATALTEKIPQPQSFAVHRTPLPAGKPSLEETLREALIPKRKKKAKKPVQQDLLF